jgi:hypothetical protein
MRKTPYLLLILFFAAISQNQAAIVFTITDPIQFAKPACYPGTYGSFPQAGDCVTDYRPTLSFSATLRNTGTEDFRVDTIYAVDSNSWFPNDPTTHTYTGSSAYTWDMTWIGFIGHIGGTGIHVAPGQTVGFVPFSVEFYPWTSFDRTAVQKLTLTLAQNSPEVTSNSQSIIYGFAPEPATALPVFVTIAGAAIWYKRRQSSSRS